MTKQEHEAKYIESLEAENATITFLHTQATDEMLKMQNRIHELEAKIAELTKENQRLNRVISNSVSKMELDTCRGLNEALREDNVRLRKDNQDLVEQINALAGKLEKAIEILADDGAIACPAIKVGYKCNNGNGCNRLDSCLTGECWAEYFEKGDKL